MMLDRSKPYGEIFGAPDGSRYEQNGKIYDINGNEWGVNSPKNTEQFSPTGSRSVIIEAPKKRGRPAKT